jgi:DNA-binding PadR family transcriptional regulator
MSIVEPFASLTAVRSLLYVNRAKWTRHAAALEGFLMSIRYAVLGLLAEAPSHGYAIRAAFEDRLGDFWDLNYGQVYQVLNALEQDALVVGSDERIGKRPVRRTYSISPKGQDALHRWMAHPPRQGRPFRDDFYVRLMFAVEKDADVLQSMIDEQIRCCRRKLELFTDTRAAQSGDDTVTTVSRLFTKAALLHAEADLQALELCRSAFHGDVSRAAPARCVAGAPTEVIRMQRGAKRAS